MDTGASQHAGQLPHRSVPAGALVSGGAAITLLLIAISVGRHPGSIAGSRTAFLLDIIVLLAIGMAGLWACREKNRTAGVALSTGAPLGMVLGAVAIANHMSELFAPDAFRNSHPLAAAAPVLIMMALFAIAGSAARQRTGSLGASALAGLWCAATALPLFIGFAFAANLVFAGRAEAALQEPFAASGFTDPAAFLVKNSLNAASEHLVRMPAIALVLSSIGGLANAWVERWNRSFVTALAGFVPVALAIGPGALSHAATLPRHARPPFIMAGLLLTGVGVVAVHPVWSALRRL